MASRAIFRRKRFFSDYMINSSHRPLQSFRVVGHEDAFPNCVECECPSTTTKNENRIDGIPLAKQLLSSGTGQLWWKGNGGSEFTSPLGMKMKWMSQSVRNATTAAKHQEVGSESDNEEELVSKKRKEASPEECDQAVEGLSSAKAKAKKIHDHKVSNSILRTTWTTFLGMGPAIKAVASMSKSYSLSLSRLNIMYVC